ncbi:MAG: hypothetical protein U9N82_05480 [Thermodesulfobacteriota bacterium]|nr:hypothetical protein [Thermodesulfobacteriota bacterium]
MALDELNEGDEVFEKSGVTYMIDKTLLEMTQPVHVDYIASDRGSGFSITSNLSAGSECGGCTSC